MKQILLFLFLAISLPAIAGNITGTVRDGKTNEPLMDVIVNIKNSAQYGKTDSAGHYEIVDVQPGTHEVVANYVTYTAVTQKITMPATGDASLDFTLVSESNELTTVSVKASRVTRTENAVIQEIRNSRLVVSGISAAQIGKTQDRNAADVVKRIPGVTVQDDRFITIRGLSDRYNSVWLNDAGAPSSEADKKAFSFDLIPAGLIDRILIMKTPSAELPGDFAGGMVKLYTTALPSKTEYTLNIQGSYRAGSTGTSDFNYLPSHTGDIFGYDNGSRDIPSSVPAEKFTRSADITNALNSSWAYKTKTQMPDLRISGSATNLFRLGGVKIGNTFGFSYANTATNYRTQRYEFFDSTSQQYHYNDKESVSKVNTALMDNVGATIGNSKFEFRNLFNQIATNSITERNNVQDSLIQSQITPLKAYQLQYENRRTYASQLSGTHHNDDDSRKYTWTLGYSSLLRNQPDTRRLQFNDLGDGTYVAAIQNVVDPNLGGGKVSTRLNEKIYSFSHQFTQIVKIGDNYSIDVNLGNYIEYKKRKYNMRELGYVLAPGANAGSLKRLPLSQIFSPENVGTSTSYQIEDGTNAYDYYEASNTLVASFLSVNLPIGKKINAVLGVRNEINDQAFTSTPNIPADTVRTKFNTKYFLPSANVTYNISEKMLLRAAYGKTLNRPEFREQAPTFYYDFTLNAGNYGAGYVGNTLKVAEIQNFDLRWELYPGTGELVHAGLFYKSFKNPIQKTIYSGNAADDNYTFINGTSAYVAGIEIDVRKNLLFLDNKLGTKFLKNLVLVGNLSMAKSQLKVDSTLSTAQGAYVAKKGPLEGQSNFVINTGFFYQSEKSGFNGSLLYNVYSPRLFALKNPNSGSIGELAFHSLDLSISKVFIKHYTVTLGAQNILDQMNRLYQDTNADGKFDTKHDQPFRTYKPGRYFTVGFKFRF